MQRYRAGVIVISDACSLLLLCIILFEFLVSMLLLPSLLLSLFLIQRIFSLLVTFKNSKLLTALMTAAQRCQFHAHILFQSKVIEFFICANSTWMRYRLTFIAIRLTTWSGTIWGGSKPRPNGRGEITQ